MQRAKSWVVRHNQGFASKPPRMMIMSITDKNVSLCSNHPNMGTAPADLLRLIEAFPLVTALLVAGGVILAVQGLFMERLARRALQGHPAPGWAAWSRRRVVFVANGAGRYPVARAFYTVYQWVAGVDPTTRGARSAPPGACNGEMRMSTWVLSSRNIVDKIKDSLVASSGDIVFGMEDDTVSIFGLVFGVAASAPDSRTVLLAGATGAAAAVSMMAGTYLDVSTAQGKARSELSREQQEIQDRPEAEASEVSARLEAAGFSATERTAIVSALQAHLQEWLKLEGETELKIGDTQDQSPVVQSMWMFISDLFAAFVPVIPFALFALGPARLVSVVITALLLVLLGLGRARVAETRLLPTVFQTVGIATGAAAAGLLIGKLVTR